MGLQVKQLTYGIFCQVKCYADRLKKYGFYDCKPEKIPMPSSMTIGADPNGVDVNATLYRWMIGSLIYLTASIHDIMFATILCACYQANSKES